MRGLAFRAFAFRAFTNASPGRPLKHAADAHSEQMRPRAPNKLPFVPETRGRISAAHTSKHNEGRGRGHRPERAEGKNANASNFVSNATITDEPHATERAGAEGGSCNCEGGQAVFVIVDSNSGSTWLGQILDHHPCAYSFVPSGMRPDGHWRAQTYGDLVTHMQQAHSRSNGKSYGVLLPRNYLERYMADLQKKPAGSVLSGNAAGPKILLYNREPIFQAISLLKKNQLFQARKEGKITRKECENVNQRGGPSCQAALGQKLKTSFSDLDEAVNKIDAHVKSGRKDAMKAAQRFKTSAKPSHVGSNFMEFSYSDLVCAQSRRGAGFLPEHVAQFLGFGSNCPTKPKDREATRNNLCGIC